MLRIGLTGGIGAGKSAAAAALAGFGAVVIDADRLAREVVEPGTPGLAAIVEAFGPEVLAADGSLDRPKLGKIVFGSDSARARLNAITHPLIGALTASRAADAPPDGVVVHDIPLIVEGNSGAGFHLVVVVMAPEDVRIRRLTELRGMPVEDAKARIGVQATDEQRVAAADVLLDNAGTPDELREAVGELWTERLLPYANNLAGGTPAELPPNPVASDPLVSGRLAFAPLQAGAGTPDPSAAGAFGRAAARLRFLLRTPDLPVDSTPGLPGVLDLRVTVPDAEAATAALDGSGWIVGAFPDGAVAYSADPGAPGRLFFEVGA
ncbi:dephospho-CoA kinase [Cryptosporangium phraense]|uniref:Dephospho-CoA kinase n=1 Tax=Cryptosporangium phraense TaxID=2593070 RepID=A0A545AJM1_9ACTN|nr:dephospho-CoA kinase [Cryptosporangium phraense]TQS41513.1 dephospho-CoA kinase [Cryptosporangium phraense]